MTEKIGLYLGRFQPFHQGHRYVVEKALKQCDKLIIAIGSSQESRTKKNPFSYEERKQLILRAYFADNYTLDRIIIVPVPDRLLYNDDNTWGQYVLDQVEKECGLRPTINFSGREECRSFWFEGIDIEEVVIERNIIPFSATAIRKALKEDDYSSFCYMAPSGFWLRYEWMKKVILEVENGKV